MCYVAILMVGEFGEEYIHVYIWMSPFTFHLKLSQYCKSAIPKQKINVQIIKNKTVLPMQGV